MCGELRRYLRFSLNEMTYIGLINGESHDIFHFAQIVNMSRGGMCAYYAPTEKNVSSISHVSVFGRTDTLLRIENIPCKIIYEIDMPAEGRSRMTEIRCGIEFLIGCLNQEKQINDFMRNFAIHPYEGSGVRR